jgi:transcriptional accessory protein Tex/SPT6
MGPKVFLNTAGFIKIDTSVLNENTVNYIEVLDGSRIHPETYEWARKMAVDALEYDEVSFLFQGFKQRELSTMNKRGFSSLGLSCCYIWPI